MKKAPTIGFTSAAARFDPAPSEFPTVFAEEVQTQVHGAVARGGATHSEVILSDETITTTDRYSHLTGFHKAQLYMRISSKLICNVKYGVEVSTKKTIYLHGESITISMALDGQIV